MCVNGSVLHFTHSVPLKSHLYTVCTVLLYHMSHCGRCEDHCCSVWSGYSHELYSCNCKLYVSPQLIGVSNLLGQCKSIRAFELYLNKGPESLNALNSCMEGVCHSSSIETLSISCLDPGQ